MQHQSDYTVCEHICSRTVENSGFFFISVLALHSHLSFHLSLLCSAHAMKKKTNKVAAFALNRYLSNHILLHITPQRATEALQATS